MIVLADPRTGTGKRHMASQRVVMNLLPSLGVEVQPTTLDFGDFAFFGNGPDGPIPIGIELKTISDFVTSMRSGKLGGHQILGLVEKYRRVYVIVEGFYRARRGSGILEIPRGRKWKPLYAGPRPIFWADVEKFIAGLEEAGVRVRRTRTSHETARVIAHVIGSFWEKDYDEHRSFNVLYRPAPLSLVKEDETTRRLRNVAACLPSIGWGRSKAVAERFRSIYAMVTANEQEWEEIEGIGKTIREDVNRAIHASIPSASTARTVPSRRVPARRRTAPRSTRRPRVRQNQQLDAGQHAQRRVSQAGRVRRVSR